MQQSSIYDVTEAFHKGNPFSREAHDSIINHKSILRNMIVEFIHNKGLKGATSDEVEQALELPHQTVSARLTEAKKLSTLVTMGKRQTRSGRNAAVLVYKGLVA